MTDWMIVTAFVSLTALAGIGWVGDKVTNAAEHMFDTVQPLGADAEQPGGLDFNAKFITVGN